MRSSGIAKLFEAMTGLLLAAIAGSSAAAAADYPERRIRFIVPHVAGAGVDALARLLGQRLSDLWGQPVVIENRPGAGGNIGAQAAARSEPDGHTLLFSTNGPLTTNVALYRSLPFDPVRDFEPIVLVCKSPTLIASSLGLPVKSVSDVIALAKQEPGKLSAGTGGHGTAAHFALAELNKAGGIDILHVPYRGAVPAMADLSAGLLALVVADPVAAQPFMQAHKVRVLAVTSAQRLAGFPEIPTVAETGLPGFDVAAWLAITAPKGTPKAIVDKLNTTINAILNEPQLKQRVIDQGFNPVVPIAPDAVVAFVRDELPRWKQRVLDAGLELQ